MLFFKHIEATASEITRNNQSFLIQSQVAEHQCISYRLFQAFHVCYYCLQSSVLQGSSENVILAISIKSVMLNLLGLERGIFVNGKLSVVVKISFYYKCLTAVIFGCKICYF